MSKSIARRIVGWFFRLLGLSILVLIAWGAYLEWDVRRWDARIEALCAANGGKDVEARIYERVMAPETEEYFPNGKKAFSIPERSIGRDMGPRYPYVYETRVVEILNKSKPSVVKFVERIVRVSDNKILSERFSYQRAGGGLPEIDFGAAGRCPIITTEMKLEVLTFLNYPKRDQGEKK